MPAERTTMRQVREIVRLHEAGVIPRLAVPDSLGLPDAAVI